MPANDVPTSTIESFVEAWNDAGLALPGVIATITEATGVDIGQGAGAIPVDRGGSRALREHGEVLAQQLEPRYRELVDNARRLDPTTGRVRTDAEIAELERMREALVAIRVTLLFVGAIPDTLPRYAAAIDSLLGPG